MKFILLLSTVIYTATVIAAPGACSLKRATKVIDIRDDGGAMTIACIECPCSGFEGACQCVSNGCCCDSTSPPMETATGW